MKETILRVGLVVKEILAPYRKGEAKNNDNVSLRVFPKIFYSITNHVTGFAKRGLICTIINTV